MFQTTTLSNSMSEEASVSSSTSRVLAFQDLCCLNPMVQQSTTDTTTYNHQQVPKKAKKKRSLPGHPDPDAEVISLSPKALLATNRFVCEICNKGFQRDQNLQLHRRGHNLPCKLKQRNKEVKKKAYVCPEPTCVHHHPSRALGDLTGIKKHFRRKHGEKKFKCERCSKIYAVHSDWKAHSKTCGTREYKCDCGTLFSRKDSFINHRAFCDALAEESARLAAATNPLTSTNQPPAVHHPQYPSSPLLFPFSSTNDNLQSHPLPVANIPPISTWDPNPNKPEVHRHQLSTPLPPSTSTVGETTTYDHHKSLVATSPFEVSLHVSTSTKSSETAALSHLSATALLHKACTMGAVNFTIASSQAAPHQSSVVVGGAGYVTSSYMNEEIKTSMGGFEPLGHVGTEVVQPPPSSDQYTGLRLTSGDLAMWQKSDHLTRDFLGLTGHQYSASGGTDCGCGGGAHVSISMNDMLKYTEDLDYAGCTTTATTTMPMFELDYSLKHQQSFGFAPLETLGDS